VVDGAVGNLVEGVVDERGVGEEVSGRGGPTTVRFFSLLVLFVLYLYL
jgi:hypothetical protein